MKYILVLALLITSACSNFNTGRTPSSVSDYQAKVDKYQEALNEGKITESEYDFLVKGAITLEKMRKISTGELKVPARTNNRESRATKLTRYNKLLSEGKLSKSEYDFLVRGLDSLDKMTNH